MYGLKNVRSRRHDALSRVGWDQLESLLAIYYREQGYQVEHCGTGGIRAQFDGGIDLKLRKNDQYILVQCKHWNAKQVPHNDVHQLLGIMVNEGATGAVLATSGEFTKAAIEAATRQGHVQLIEGEELRAMIGPIAEPVAPGWDQMSQENSRAVTHAFAGRITERLLAAAEDRIRHGSQRSFRSGSSALLWIVVLKLAFALALLLLFSVMLRNALAPLTHLQSVRPDKAQSLPTPSPPAQGYVSQAARSEAIGSGASVAPPVIHQPTKAEIREQQRKANEAMEILKESTPEM